MEGKDRLISMTKDEHERITKGKARVFVDGEECVPDDGSTVETVFVKPLPTDPESLKEREMQLPHFFKVMDEYEDFLEKPFRVQVLDILRGEVPFLDGPRNLTRDEFYRLSKHHKLPARVSELRKRGHVIDGPMVEAPSGRSRVRDYRLQHDDERGINYIWEDGHSE